MSTLNELSNRAKQHCPSVGKNIISLQAGGNRTVSGIVLDGSRYAQNGRKRPIVFSNLESGEGIKPIANFIIQKGELATNAAPSTIVCDAESCCLVWKRAARRRQAP